MAQKKVANGIRIRKYTVVSRNVKCDDGVERDNVKLTAEYAKPIGIVSSQKVARMTTPSTVANTVTSECVSYKLDENGNKVNARIFRPAQKSPNRRKLSEADTVELMDRIHDNQPLTVNDLATLTYKPDPRFQHNYNV